MTISWYSISIVSQTDGIIFNGYFSVNNATNLVISFYETINGSTNFNNNILIPTGTGTQNGNYLGFNTYNIPALNLTYDNAYLSNWFQFDENGVIIKSMSRYPEYSIFNFFAENEGYESINNIGTVGINTNTTNGPVLTNISFTIKQISDPTIQIPRPFSMNSFFTNNAQVYYKPHSLSTGSGGVTNSRQKKRKT
jgi:hypothetical protein